MRYVPAGAGIGLVLCALALQGPAAAADDAELRISPRIGIPGSTVTVSTTACGSETYGKGFADGDEFHLLDDGHKGVLTGHFRIPEGAASGPHDVIVKCPPSVKITDTVEVVHGRPSGGVHAGFGPAAVVENKPTLLGGAVLAVTAGGVLMMRRHRSVRR
ncbi:sortase [Streptomyces sp. NPDC021212]|uniref:sortase n=1 Tax=Streptomyces sp. NPDC021212 TaxID=3365118 RepID=UPI00379A8084